MSHGGQEPSPLAEDECAMTLLGKRTEEIEAECRLWRSVDSLVLQFSVDQAIDAPSILQEETHTLVLGR